MNEVYQLLLDNRDSYGCIADDGGRNSTEQSPGNSSGFTAMTPHDDLINIVGINVFDNCLGRVSSLDDRLDLSPPGLGLLLGAFDQFLGPFLCRFASRFVCLQNTTLTERRIQRRDDIQDGHLAVKHRKCVFECLVRQR